MKGQRRRLIFFAASDPAGGSRAVWSAYHFGLVAQRAGLDAEVRLAGDAVNVLTLPETGAEGRAGPRASMAEARDAALLVST